MITKARAHTQRAKVYYRLLAVASGSLATFSVQ